MVAKSTRSSLPSTLIINTKTNIVLISPDLAQFDPDIFNNMNLEDIEGKTALWTID